MGGRKTPKIMGHHLCTFPKGNNNQCLGTGSLFEKERLFPMIRENLQKRKNPSTMITRFLQMSIIPFSYKRDKIVQVDILHVDQGGEHQKSVRQSVSA